MCPLLHTIQMTIECIVLAKAGDEVGDGPMVSVQLFTGGMTCLAVDASRWKHDVRLAEACQPRLPSIPQSTCRRGCRNKVSTPPTPSSHAAFLHPTSPPYAYLRPSSAITCCNSTSISDCSNYPGAMATWSEVKHSSGRSSSLVLRTGRASNALLTTRLKRTESTTA